MSFDLRHLRAFSAVAEELHFGKAAESLHMAQPALTRLIQQLEADVGVTLLDRTTRRVALTEAGKTFLAEIQLAQVHIEQAVTRARHVANGMRGELRIAYTDFAINGRLPQFLNAFANRHPDIRMNLVFMPTTVQQMALLEQKIDIGFMIGSFEHETMDSYQFDEDRYVALLPVAHPLCGEDRLTLAHLANENFVLGNGENWTAFRNRLFALCRARNFFPRIVQEASSSEGIFGLVVAGAGVTVYSSCVSNLQRKGVAIRTLEDVGATLPVTAVWERRNRSPGFQTFRNFLMAVWGQRHQAQSVPLPR
ncbi:LysR substrate-binding domain-containing protein [Rhizobium sp. TRM96647]|uniref:LysR family transcriptional regulator n=1 Tax=unclassified Rhizobium TaxID=2613769 RepID=UPI0021E80A57|nr:MULTISPECIES: LysR substrate-binding domain-containing protein [unclassified Rhizobium]MCV3737349.1 LysR substrate-binding domain-containing protein [Rhizobium sp. TRM96647]MCV3759333.1 LysR substrate-binding domain-containing protein [Rhizobium sp. TRM96650]